MGVRHAPARRRHQGRNRDRAHGRELASTIRVARAATSVSRPVRSPRAASGRAPPRGFASAAAAVPVAPEQGESWADAYHGPVSADALDKIAWTGDPAVRAMVTFTGW